MFLDLFNLSSFLLPRSYIPPLTREMKSQLRVIEEQEDAEEKDCEKSSKMTSVSSPSSFLSSHSPCPLENGEEKVFSDSDLDKSLENSMERSCEASM